MQLTFALHSLLRALAYILLLALEIALAEAGFAQLALGPLGPLVVDEWVILKSDLVIYLQFIEG